MQIVFDTQQQPSDYADKHGAGVYPDAPARCLHPGCGIPVPMAKSGFYRRHVITSIFTGLIRIRRYKCKICGHTVSMLPSFCVPRHVYGVVFIVCLMAEAIRSSKRRAARVYQSISGAASRRQVSLYLFRLRQNRKFIEYGFNQLSPGGAGIGDPPGDIEWTERLLCAERAPRFWPETNAKFHKTMGKSFMSTQNRVA